MMEKLGKVLKHLKGAVLMAAVVVLFVTGASKAKAADINSAIDISNGAARTGSVAGYNKGDENWYKYTASGSGYVNFTLGSAATLTTDTPQWGLAVYSYDGNLNEVYDDNSDASHTTPYYMVNAGSTYYLCVEWSINSANKNYNIKANFTSHPNVVNEPNNSGSTAKAVAFGAEHVGVIDDYNDSDFFKITAPQAGLVKMDLKRYQLTAKTPEWKFTVYDEAMNELYSINSVFKSDSHNTEGVYYALQKGKTIYVKISEYNYNQCIGEMYSFTANFTNYKNVEKENNDNFASANKIQLKKTYKGVMGEGTSGGDYYWVKTKGSGKYKVRMNLLKDVEYGYKIYVYDKKRRLVASSKNTIYKAGTLKFKAQRNKKYYIQVKHASGGFFGGICVGTPYDLTVRK